MSSHAKHPHRRSLAGVVVAAVLLVMLPMSASAHSELNSSDPAEGASVPSPFSGPVVLTFSEQLAEGSKADLYGPSRELVATATVDAVAATMTFSLISPLAQGGYAVEWVSIAGDGDLLRGTVTFSVAAAAPSPTPDDSNTATSSSPATIPPSAAATAGAATAGAGTPGAATPAASPTSGDTGSSSDVVLPIVIALIVAAAGAFYLVRRNRPA